MITEKLLDLIYKVYKKTIDGSISWKPTVDDYSFIVVLNNGGFTISQNGEDYSISIHNADGVLIETIWDRDLPAGIVDENSFTLVSSLYAMARSNALGLDKTIDDMLDNLNAMDLPF
jgi:hypothetical protein